MATPKKLVLPPRQHIEVNLQTAAGMFGMNTETFNKIHRFTPYFESLRIEKDDQNGRPMFNVSLLDEYSRTR
jgi:hypothetical protein